ncbi:MAG: hypothetical protein KJO18_02500 [Acidimicrobiia bacterium]|nr:hypothetical protein [Acidimicrobiia bacterium]
MADWPNDPLEELARELRQTIGGEFRAEAEITERETHIGRLRRLGLADIARAAMHRGDLVSLITSTHTITGELDYVGKDYLVCQTKTESVDAPFARVLIEVRSRAAGGHDARGGSITFKARLSEYEHSGELLTLTTAEAGIEVRGRILVVTTDHCIVDDLEGRRMHIPYSQIALVIRPRSDV